MPEKLLQDLALRAANYLKHFSFLGTLLEVKCAEVTEVMSMPDHLVHFGVNDLIGDLPRCMVFTSLHCSLSHPHNQSDPVQISH